MSKDKVKELKEEKVCPTCGGTGVVDEEKSCSECKGSGKV